MAFLSALIFHLGEYKLIHMFGGHFLTWPFSQRNQTTWDIWQGTVPHAGSWSSCSPCPTWVDHEDWLNIYSKNKSSVDDFVFKSNFPNIWSEQGWVSLKKPSSKSWKNFAFAKAYGVLGLFALPFFSGFSLATAPLPPFPLPFAFPFPLAAAFACGVRASLRAAVRRRWACGVTGFCFPKTRFRIGAGMEETGVRSSTWNSALDFF